MVAQESGLSEQYLNEIKEKSQSSLYDLYLSNQVAQMAINAQAEVIKKIASQGSCVIVGRAADYVLKDNESVVSFFIYAPEEYRIKKIQEMYGDDEKTAKENMLKSDKARANYYKNISGKTFGDAKNYDFCIDSSIGNEKTAEMIIDFINKKTNKK